MKNLSNLIGGICVVVLFAISYAFAYTQEELEAYQWAYRYNITTQPTIEAANLDGSLTREAFAKMIVNYLENVIGVKNEQICSFPDIENATSNLRFYMQVACGYKIMGENGVNFNPKQIVNRAQLGTVLSRVLWGGEYNSDGKGYYIYHLNALKQSGIMNNINNPQTYAKRGDVLVMLKRIYEKFGSYIYMNGVSISPYDTTEIMDEYIDDDYTIEDGEQIIYYDDGKIAVKMNFKNGEKDGVWESYYENGQLEKKNIFKDGEYNGEQLSYYENGQLESKEFYKNGEYDGEQVFYYENGQLGVKGYFKNGVEDGEFVYYHENGKIGGKEIYKNGVENGEFTSYYENGQLESKEFYKNGEYDGEQFYYYENGKLESKESYKNGIENGEFISYYENEQLKFEMNYVNGVENGNFVYYYKNGGIQGKGSFRNGEKDGEWVYYYENGQLYIKEFYEEGILNGDVVAYYENGQLKEKGKFKNGKLEGNVISYYENGQLKGKGNYKNGIENGKFVYYYENGNINLEINFKDGIFNGKYINYFEDGKITELNYKSGKLDGTQTGYYEDGSLRFLHKFKDGFGTKSFFDKNGNLIGTGTEVFTDEFDEDGGTYKSIINGLEISYYEIGQIYELGNYKNGELDGTQILYYESGKTKSICKYSEGIINGECTVYDENGKIIESFDNSTYSYYVLPDSVKIDVKNPINVGEATDLQITVMKNGKKMDDYTGTLYFYIESSDGSLLKSNEYTIPNWSIYTFSPTDLGFKKFQSGLKIEKEGTFYFQVEDLNDPDEKVLGRQTITVIKKS